MSNLTEKLIDVYKNAPSVENLCKLLIYDLDCEFILISWSVGKQYWFIADIYDIGIERSTDSSGVNKSSGWYLTSEPNEDNIPIRHSILSDCCFIKSSLGKIIYAKITKDKAISPRAKRKEHTALSSLTSSLSSITNPILPTSPTPNKRLPESFVLDNIYKFIVCAFLDKLATDDLMFKQKTRQESMLSNISHSIRTPLNGILHMCNAVTTQIKLNDLQKVTEHLNYLNQSAVALATNIFDIVDLTKLELGKLSLNKDVFDIREMMTTVMSLANSLNKSKNVVLDHYIAPSVPDYIFSDKKRIKQILINLLENSLQHTTSGEITLHVDSTVINLADEDSERENSVIENVHGLYGSNVQHSISFIVKDTGSGMDEKTKAGLFGPIEMTSDTKQYGISLRLSNMLACLLSGKLSLIYSDIGRGSCFEFNIIVCEEEMPEKQSNTLRSLKGKTVLLIDPTPERIEICKALEKYSMVYTISSTYEEVMILHTGKKFDLIIIHDDNLESYVEITQQVNCGILLGISDTSYKSNKLLNFSDVMNVPTDPNEYKSKILELFNTTRNNKTNLDKYKILVDKCKILVVEDEQINRIVIEKILRQIGYKKIYLAVNGQDALKQFDLIKPDIMLIDIRMPLMSGFELAERIHHLCTSYHIDEPKMLGVTAQIVLEDDIKPWFKDFIYKPIDIVELDNKIKELLTKVC